MSPVDVKDEHHVHDSHLRSGLVIITGNAMEYAVDVVFLNYIGQPIVRAFEGSVVLNLICIATSFIALRIWNEIKWGRKVEELE